MWVDHVLDFGRVALEFPELQTLRALQLLGDKIREHRARLVGLREGLGWRQLVAGPGGTCTAVPRSLRMGRRRQGVVAPTLVLRLLKFLAEELA